MITIIVRDITTWVNIWEFFWENVIWDISFSNFLWSWQSQINLSLISKIWEIDFIWKAIEIFFYEKIVYTWIVTKTAYSFSWTVNLFIIWIYDLINRVDLTTLHPANTWGSWIRTIINYINSLYPNYKFWKDIDTWTYYLKSDTSSVVWTELIRNICEKTNYDFYVWADRIVKYKQSLSSKIHYLSVWEEVFEWVIWEDISSSITDYRVINSISNNTRSYFNLVLESKIWKIERDVIDTIWYIDWDWIPHYNWEEYLMSRESKAQIEKNWMKNLCELNISYDKYDIFSIEVWDYISIKNLWVVIPNTKVVKIDFTYKTCKLYLDNYFSISKSLL